MAADEVQPESTVTFTVKELLEEQTGLLRQIDSKVDGKADKADLIPIMNKLETHDTRLLSIEDERKTEKVRSDARAAARRRVWAFVAAVVVPLEVALILVLL